MDGPSLLCLVNNLDEFRLLIPMAGIRVKVKNIVSKAVCMNIILIINIIQYYYNNICLSR